MKSLNWKVVAIAALLGAVAIEAFQQLVAPVSFGGIRYSRFRSSNSQLWGGENDESANQEDEKVEVGSKEYMQGFLSSPIQDESVAERGSGLEQALKLGGGVAVVLILLVVGFLASNGLI